MSSTYVYEGPVTSQPISNSFELNPVNPKPQDVQNIVTAKYKGQELSQQYQPLKLVDAGSGRICAPKAKLSNSSKSEVLKTAASGDQEKMEGIEEKPQNALLNQIDAWVSGITPEQWRKYALYGGIALLGKKLLCK